MKKILLLLFLFHASFSILAQDIIYTTRDRIDCKVKVISDDIVYFTVNPTNRDSSLNKENIILIAFANGSFEYYRNSKTDLNQQVMNKFTVDEDLYLTSGKNILAWNAFDILLGTISIEYERIIAKGKLGLVLPVAYRYSDIIYEYSTGIDLKFYPWGQRKSVYFCGPSFRVFRYDYSRYNDIGIYFNQGWQVMVSPGTVFSINLGIGITDLEYLEPHAFGGIKLGKRF